jgi:hypothetical protein
MLEREVVADKFRFLIFSKLLVFVLSSIILSGTVSNLLFLKYSKAAYSGVNLTIKSVGLGL